MKKKVRRDKKRSAQTKKVSFFKRKKDELLIDFIKALIGGTITFFLAHFR